MSDRSKKLENLVIHREETTDIEEVFNVVQSAFESIAFSDHDEQFLVDRLRGSEAFILELSLVATIDKQIVGHILLTRIIIVDEHKEYSSLTLAPVSVLPKYQRQGVGSALICAVHNIAISLDFSSVVLVGHEAYYPRFGYRPTEEFGITFPFAVPRKKGLVCERVDGTLNGYSRRLNMHWN